MNERRLPKTGETTPLGCMGSHVPTFRRHLSTPYWSEQLTRICNDRKQHEWTSISRSIDVIYDQIRYVALIRYPR